MVKQHVKMVSFDWCSFHLQVNDIELEDDILYLKFRNKFISHACPTGNLHAYSTYPFQHLFLFLTMVLAYIRNACFSEFDKYRLCFRGSIGITPKFV